MVSTELNRIAFLKGINPIGKSKFEIIRMIQLKEGYAPCYGTKQFRCNKLDCLWRSDCQGIVHPIKIE